MRSDKLSEERIGESLAILDELKASGMKAEVFAQSKGLGYGQLRGWLSRAPRWSDPAATAQRLRACPMQPAPRTGGGWESPARPRPQHLLAAWQQCPGNPWFRPAAKSP